MTTNRREKLPGRAHVPPWVQRGVNSGESSITACSLGRLSSLLALLLGAFGLSSLQLDAVELFDHESTSNSEKQVRKG